MRIHVNGEMQDVRDGTTLLELVSDLKLKPEQIAIELNREVIRRIQWESVVLKEDDKLEIVHFVGGGGQ